MPANITDVDAFTTPVVVPVGSDAAGLTYITPAYQALANRTHYLNKLANDVTTRTFVVSPWECTWTSGWTPSASSLLSTTNSAELRMSLDFLPNGALLRRIRVLVTPGANTMDVTLSKRTLTFTGSPSAGSNTNVFIGASSGTALQAIDIDLTGLEETIDRAGGTHFSLQLTANSGAGASNDTLWGFQIVADLVGIGAF